MAISDEFMLQVLQGDREAMEAVKEIAKDFHMVPYEEAANGGRVTSKDAAQSVILCVLQLAKAKGYELDKHDHSFLSVCRKLRDAWTGPVRSRDQKGAMDRAKAWEDFKAALARRGRIE